jgi:CyaY protein
MALQHLSILSTVDMNIVPTPLTDSRYRQLTSDLLSGIEAEVDRWLQDGLVDIDTQRSGGLLELTFPGGSKIILNTQPPLQELWMAARSGGFHYKHVDGQWRDTRDGRDFFDALSACASDQAETTLRFAPRL